MERRSAPRATVVVAVRGNTPALDGLLAALAEQRLAGGFEVVVADNHADRTVTAPTDGWPFPVRVVHVPARGLSRARNAGVRLADGEMIAVTDPDARPRPGWLAGLADALSTTGAWCAGGRVLPRLLGSPRPRLSPEVAQMFIPPSWPRTVTPLRPPWWLVGCNLAFRRSPLPLFCTYLGAGAHGPGRMSCEDLEITVRAHAAALGVVVVPGAVVERAIHADDVRLAALAARAYGHGASMARLRALHPDAPIYDSYRLGDAVRMIRAGLRPALIGLSRVAGYRLARTGPTGPGGWS